MNRTVHSTPPPNHHPRFHPHPLLLLLLLLLVPFDIAVRAVTKRPGAGMRRCSRVACAEPPPLSVDLGDLRLLRWRFSLFGGSG